MGSCRLSSFKWQIYGCVRRFYSLVNDWYAYQRLKICDISQEPLCCADAAASMTVAGAVVRQSFVGGLQP